MSAMIDTDRLTVRFGGATALNGVSLTVSRGEIHGLAGPNGSGKTTLLNAISGFVQSHGRIFIGGKSVNGTPAHRRARLGFGRTFQNPKMPSGMTVGELLKLGDHLGCVRPWGSVVFRLWHAARAQGVFEMEAGELLERLGLPRSILAEAVETLPSGSLKMIDVARALMPEPLVLALDEPTSGMNEREIDQLLTWLRVLRDQGMTILIIEHNLRVLSSICDTMTILHLGGVLSEGMPSEVFGRREVIEAYLGESHERRPVAAGGAEVASVPRQPRS